MSKVLERFRQNSDQLLIDESRNLNGAKSAVGRDDAVELAIPAFLDELCTVGRSRLHQFCDITQGSPRRMCA